VSNGDGKGEISVRAIEIVGKDGESKDAVLIKVELEMDGGESQSSSEAEVIMVSEEEDETAEGNTESEVKQLVEVNSEGQQRI